MAKTQQAEFNNLETGLITDLPPWQLPEGAASDIQNIRFDDGCAQAFFQHRVLVTPAAVPTGIRSFNNGVGNGRQILIPCANNNIYLYGTADATLKTVHTGAAALPSSNTAKWTFATYPNIIIAMHPDQSPLYLANPDGYWETPPTSPVMADLDWDNGAGSTWASLNNRALFMRQFGDNIMAFNMNENGSKYPARVRWPEPYLPGDIPPQWDESDTSTIAGYYDLDDTEGAIWEARQLRGRMIIYKQDGIFAGDKTYGDDYLAFTGLFESIRALITDSVVEFNGRHFALTGDDAIVHNGVDKDSVIDGWIKGRMFKELNDKLGKVHVFPNHGRNEIWICIPTDAATVADKAYVWNYKSGGWSERDVPNLNQADSMRVADASQDGRWFPWAEYPIGASSDGNVYELDTMVGAAGVAPACYWERRGISLGDWRTGATVTALRLRMQSRVDVTVSVGHHDTPNGAVTWDTSRTFSPDSEYKLDCNAGGRYQAIKVESDSLPAGAYSGEQAAGWALWSLYGMTIDYVPHGTR